MARVRPQPGDGSAWIVALLLASLGIAGVVVWQAQDAARSHRAMAERVLRDYAGLAADEMVRRSSSQIGYFGYFVLIRALENSAEDPEPPPSPTTLADTDDERLQRATALANCTFRYRPIDHRLAIGGPEPPVAVADWLRDQLASPEHHLNDDEASMAFLHGQVEDRAVTAVFRPADATTARDEISVVGFLVEPAGLADAFARC